MPNQEVAVAQKVHIPTKTLGFMVMTTVVRWVISQAKERSFGSILQGI